jgi:putative RNA 2'-phosphotransferase
MSRRSRDPVVERSRRLSWLLRHGAPEQQLVLDPAGFAPVTAVLRHLHLSEQELQEVVAQNDKARFELRGDRIRACQGHSLGSGVAIAALEASWAPFTEPMIVWHGTGIAAVDGIAAEGIIPAGRTHVHLAASFASVVGKRSGTPVMLGVSCPALAAAGVALFRSPNGVVLARHVPVACITELVPMSAAARQAAPRLRALLRLVPDAPSDPAGC